MAHLPVADARPFAPLWGDNRYTRHIARDKLPANLAQAAGVPLWATSHGPTADDKKLEIALTIS